MQNIKCVAVGDGAVGKTSLLHAYVDKTFTTDYVPTIFDNEQCSINVDGKEYVLGIWDTAGQEGFDRLRPLSYPESDIFLICFDVSSRQSFDNLKAKWISEIHHHQPGTPFMVVGTKSDLRDNIKAMEGSKPSEDFEREAKEVGALDYIECSSKARINLDEVFESAVRLAVADKKKKAESAAQSKKGASVKDTEASSGCQCVLM
mmetsp:Transcript_25077/g.30601  ORF Transcript_25077/g.30601 Transcript_25077/m.30601 type:complete len:204 (+) Transcript_25077:161-772(+)|eukprot:CAMPEP_0204842586 /NCGR_PEP_ID=MMETSP1346-20131115/47151_1 /ASSEMBLY_ACC=CAM_ASM_000771 /TAXON_ID=215587 /ORGANISM="Aplanochytrium stocchinoi, Strain GSBS06" /LENGTH=203 /DNA_ID=CAMNT_0051981529 /DNA_START=79 /DNA_END=690 /DNA_ORIENTATION=+